MSFKQFMRELGNNKVEGKLIKIIFLSLVTSFLVLAFFYFTKLKYVENFIPKYGFFIFFSILTYALIIPSVIYVRAYKEFACMSGMMIGMTIGMISGFLPGLFVGSTNGMFVGTIFGMSIGIIFGIWNGKCCGIMGMMEGTMAGFMGGLMGAMTAIMMLNDHLKSSEIIFFSISAFIMFGLNYMIYKETREMEIQNESGEFLAIFWSFILTTLTIWIMVFGLRSALFQ